MDGPTDAGHKTKVTATTANLADSFSRGRIHTPGPNRANNTKLSTFEIFMLLSWCGKLWPAHNFFLLNRGELVRTGS